jgi:hypothetical protein
MTPITYRTVEVDDVKIFYREAVRPTLRRCFCCMAFPVTAACSGI